MTPFVVLLSALLVVSVTDTTAFQPRAFPAQSLTRLLAELPTAESIASAPFMASFDFGASVCDGLLGTEATLTALLCAALRCIALHSAA
jgi:hypothetical protein